VFDHLKVESFSIQERNVWTIEPINKEVERTILFLHGGGFAKNFQHFHWRFIERMSSELNARVYAPDYPLLPNVPG
jgi:acetyl esterase/lipase